MLVRNHYFGRTFIEPKQSIRHFGVNVKLNPVREVVEGQRVVLIDGTGKTIELDADSVEVLVPQQKSLMPDLLFRDMTAAQLADLLAFLNAWIESREADGWLDSTRAYWFDSLNWQEQ